MEDYKLRLEALNFKHVALRQEILQIEREKEMLRQEIMALEVQQETARIEQAAFDIDNTLKVNLSIPQLEYVILKWMGLDKIPKRVNYKNDDEYRRYLQRMIERSPYCNICKGHNHQEYDCPEVLKNVIC